MKLDISRMKRVKYIILVQPAINESRFFNVVECFYTLARLNGRGRHIRCDAKLKNPPPFLQSAAELQSFRVFLVGVDY